MCGIIGRFNRYGGVKAITNENLQRMQHRGPDGSGILSDNHVSLGHTRLSIIDLSTQASQPMSSSDKRHVLTYNGEIYNYVELRRELEDTGITFRSRSDTEVVLAAFRQWGISCLSRLRGMFAFGLWDSKAKTLLLARDRCGEKPLVYWRDGEQFCFSSEMKSLVPILPETPPLLPAAIDLYMHYQYVPEPFTPLKNILKLPPAHYLLIDPDNWNVEPQQYWRFEDVPEIKEAPGPLIREELRKAIHLTLRSDVPVGVALSGGIDSGGIAAIAAPEYKDTMKAFSVGYPGRPPFDERNQAEGLARLLGLEFHDIELRSDELVAFFPKLVAHMNDPIADIAAYGHYAVARAAADEGIKVLLTGIGGDEVFWGYGWTRDLIHLNRQRTAAMGSIKQKALGWIGGRCDQALLTRLANSNRSPQIFKNMASRLNEAATLVSVPEDEAIFMSIVPDFNQALIYAPTIYEAEFAAEIPSRNAFSPLKLSLVDPQQTIMGVRRLLFDTWLVSNCLDLGDGVSMGSSVETRIPYLDFRLIELVVGLEKGHPDFSPGYKTWMRDALQGILPDEVMTRPKQGFQPPVLEWLDHLLGKYGELLIAGRLVQSGMISGKTASQLLAGNLGTIFFAFKLLLLELWYRIVVAGESL